MISRDADGIVQTKYANSGDVGLGGLDLDELWDIAYSTPGGLLPQRIQFNQLFRYLSALSKEINQNGPFLGYDILVDYGIGAVVNGSDDTLYFAVAANGPTTSVVDPVGDLTGTWSTFASKFLPSTLPKGYINGLILSNHSDADHDISVSVGECADSTNAADIVLSSAMMKQIDAAWAVGTGNGGLFSGSVAVANWYHLFAIIKDSDDSIDVGFDTSITAANIPAGYTKYRRLGSVLTDGSANILRFVQIGDDFVFDLMALDVADTNPGVLANLSTISTPPGVTTTAKVIVSFSETTLTTTRYLLASSPLISDIVPDSARFHLKIGDNARREQSEMQILTDTTSQIRYRIESSVAATSINISTIGYRDYRGKE